MAVIEVSVVPLGTKTPSVSSYVARALGILEKAEGIKYELTPMGTIIEGDLDKILELAKEMHEITFDPEVQRVVTTIKIDDRRDKSLTMEGKITSVRRKQQS
jgi:uncharacterized protein (TIGR00106 family)